MTFLIQEEGLFMLGSLNPKELVLEMFKVGSKMVENLYSRLTT